MNRNFLCVLVLCGFCQATFAQGEPAVIDKIVDQGKNHSHAWEYLDHLAQVVGPRLTGSSRALQANAWTRDTFASFGLTNAHLFKWGEIPVAFDRGECTVRMVKPVEQDFEFTTRSWTAGTNGPVKGPVVRQPRDMDELKAMGDKLNGSWVLAKPRTRGRGPGGGARSGPTSRPDGEPTRENQPRDRSSAASPSTQPDRPTSQPADPEEELVKAMYDAGILGRIVASGNELVITSGARNWRELDIKNLPKEVSITVRRSDYDALNSRLADGEEVIVEANLQHHFVEGPFPMYDTIAEIPGSEHPEQVVIVSGHLDSWDGPGSQGAQDNGVGSATTLETARILAAAGVKPKRTIRFCLWTGEEQGLLGSKEYVKSLSDDEKANISAVFVDDGGTNYDGGLQCVANMQAMLTAAVEPVNKAFPDMPVKINVRERMPRGGASDHASFNAVGIPGFFWDEVGSGGREGKDYNFIHHTQHDQIRYAVPEYLVQSATCAAITAYNLAMADTLLPRYVPPAPKEESPSTSQPEKQGEFVATQGPLTGTWEGSFVRPRATGGQADGGGGRGFGGFTLTFEMSADGRVRGSSVSRMGENKMSDIKFDPASHELSWKIRSENIGTVNYKATLEGDTISGTVNSEEADFTMPFKATRQKAEESATPPVAGTGRTTQRGGS
jgi:carboxypeptidase Q